MAATTITRIPALTPTDGDRERKRERARRLRVRADAIRRGEFQVAHQHGDHDRADQLADFAYRLDERADLRAAESWVPKVEVAPLSPAMRRRLNRVFAARLAERERERLAERERERLAERARRARHDDDTYGPRYAEVALERETATVAAAPVGVRNETLNRAAWSLARLVCEGLLSEGDVLGALVGAARAVGLPGREAHAVVRAALRRRCGRAA